MTVKEDLNKLKRTTVVVCFHAFFVGVQYSCIYVTALYYMINVLDIKNSEPYYATAMALISVSSTLSDFLVVRYIHVFTCLRRFMASVILVTILGNFAYSFHLSIFVVFVGVFFCGTGDATQNVVFDHLSKIYADSIDLTSLRSRYELVYTVGFVGGPVFVAMLAHLKIYIGHWYITKYNGIGFVLAIILTFILLLVLCFVSNVLKEKEVDAFDEHNQKLIERRNYNKAVSFDGSSEEYEDEKVNSYRTFLYILTNFDLTFIMMCSMVISFITNSIEITITITAAIDLQLNITQYCLLVSGCLFVYAFAVSKIWNIYFSYRKKREYLSLVVCLALNALSCGLMVLTNIHPEIPTTRGVKILLLILAIITNSTSGVSINSACVDLFFVHVSENYLEKIEKHRTIIHRVIGLLGLLIAGYFHTHIESVYLAFLLLSIMLFVVALIRKSHLTTKKQPSQIEY